MPNWMLKAAVQGIVSALPHSHSLNQLLQRHVTRSIALTPELLRLKLKECKRHVDNYANAKGALSPSDTRAVLTSVLEIGTGWDPIIPVGLHLCGAHNVWTVDRANLLVTQRLRQLLQALIECANRGELSELLPIRAERISDLHNVLCDATLNRPSEILQAMGIQQIVFDNGDSLKDIPPVDLILSNTTLEYIPTPALSDLFSEFRRLAAPGGIMSHFVIMGDHYSDFDHSISPYNYLKYDQPSWRLFNNRLHYQNRLRLSDYRKLHQTAGFRIVSENWDEGSKSDLDRIRVASQFRAYPKEELLMIRAWIVSTR